MYYCMCTNIYVYVIYVIYIGLRSKNHPLRVINGLPFISLSLDYNPNNPNNPDSPASPDSLTARPFWLSCGLDVYEQPSQSEGSENNRPRGWIRYGSKIWDYCIYTGQYHPPNRPNNLDNPYCSHVIYTHMINL